LAAVVASHIATAVEGTATAAVRGTATAIEGIATASSRCSSGGKAVAVVIVVVAAAAGQGRTCLISFSIESCHSAIDCS